MAYHARHGSPLLIMALHCSPFLIIPHHLSPLDNQYTICRRQSYKELDFCVLFCFILLFSRCTKYFYSSDIKFKVLTMPKTVETRSRKEKNAKKRVPRKSGKIVRRPTRIISKPDRLGIRRSSANGDQFFENLNRVQIEEAQMDTVSLESTDDTPTSMISLSSISTENLIENSNESVNLRAPITSSPNSLQSNERSIEIIGNKDRNDSFETMVLLQLKEILIRIGQLERHVAEVDTRIIGITNELKSDRQVSKSATKINSIEQQDLLKYGLPVNSPEMLDKLEKQLSESEFSKKVVSAKNRCLNLMRFH